MTAELNIIFRKELGAKIKKQLLLFAYNCKMELINIEEKAYWKDERCDQMQIQLLFSQYSYEKIKYSITQFGINEQDINYSEDNECIEYAVYPSLSEILQSDNVFLVLNFQKKQKNNQGTVL